MKISGILVWLIYIFKCLKMKKLFKNLFFSFIMHSSNYFKWFLGRTVKLDKEENFGFYLI